MPTDPCILDPQSDPSCPGYIPPAADSSVVRYTRYDFGGKTHYYAYFGSALSFSQAKLWAETNTFRGVTGHLPTITSMGENDAMANLASSIESNAWLGLEDTTHSYSGGASPSRTWRWTAGTENGTEITSCTDWVDFESCSGAGAYSNWYSGEPNNSGGTEAVGEFYGFAGQWNDVTDDGRTNGVIVEYTLDSIAPAEDVSNLAFVPGNSTSAPDAPTAVSAIAGDGEAKVSWTAPANDGGDAITAYKATASNGEFCETAVGVSEDFYSCTITGLDNYTDVTFTVVATNSVGDSVPSEVSDSVVPHTSEFQVWVRNPLLKYGQSTDVYVFGAQDFDSVSLRIGLDTTTFKPDASGTYKTSHTADPNNGWDRIGFVSVKATSVTMEADGTVTRTYANGMINIPRSYATNRVRAFGAVKIASRAVPEGKTVSYQINGTEVCTADADDKGRTSCLFEAPETEGDYTIDTWIGDTLYASNTFTVFTKGNAVPQ
ncbi:MAG: hypothetical protein EBU85_07375 [Actinobacteria bacterium]|nr:hypothetical protein [Actinomycetota bacterium]